MNILFVHNSRHVSAPWMDGSARYRCYHLAESLRRQGCIADVTTLAELQLERLDRYHIVSVLRPRPGKALEKLLKRCRRLGIRTVADADDLVFVPRYAGQSPSVINQQAAEFSVRTRFEENLNAMLEFDEITVATQPLAKHWAKQTGRTLVTVVPNGLSGRWLATPVQTRSRDLNASPIITYLPGSNSHEKDFSEIAEILAETLCRHRHAELLIVGKLNASDTLFPQERVTRSPWVNYNRLPQIIASSSVTLAPLVPSPFTFAKSHIKFIESAAFGAPAICSPNDDICRHSSHGLSVATCADDWRDALTRALENPLSSAELKSMQNQVRETETADNSASILTAHWQNSNLELQQNAA